MKYYHCTNWKLTYSEANTEFLAKVFIICSNIFVWFLSHGSSLSFNLTHWKPKNLIKVTKRSDLLLQVYTKAIKACFFNFPKSFAVTFWYLVSILFVKNRTVLLEYTISVLHSKYLFVIKFRKYCMFYFPWLLLLRGWLSDFVV